MTKRSVLAAFLAVPALGLLASSGCGRQEWQPGNDTLALTDPIEEPLGDPGTYVTAVEPEADVIEMGRVLKISGAPQVIFSNFSDGSTTLKSGSDNAMMNRTQIGGCGIAYPAWKGTDSRKKTLQGQLQSMMNDYNVVLASTRPTDPPYSMIMIGPSQCAGPGAGGIAPLDCGNRNPASVCFDFSSTGSVITMAQEIGHTFGLGHNDVACDVMGASYTKMSCSTGKWGYIDKSGPILGGSGACVGSTQNSYQEMLKVLGAWPGGTHPDPNGEGKLCTDMAGPSVTFTEPHDGDSVDNSFSVKADAMDDCPPVKSVHIEIPSQSLSADATQAPYEWALDSIPDAKDMEIILTVTDGAGNTSMASIKVTVGHPEGGGGGQGGSGQGGSSGSGGDGGSNQVGGSGCQVASSAGARGAALALFGLALALRLRRRSRSGRASDARH